MSENNAAQPGLTDDDILQVFSDVVGNQEDDARFIDVDRDQAIRIARTLLSKLRAEGVQAGEPVADAKRIREWLERSQVPGKPYLYCLKPSEIDAALASAPVAGEAPTDAEIIDMAVEPLGIDCDRMPYGVIVFARALLAQYAAPQASEAVAELPAPVNGEARAWSFAAPGPMADEVRNAALEEAAKQCEDIYSWRGAYSAGVLHQTTLDACASAIRAMTAQADKDGGDCAKGAGDGDLHFIAGTIVLHLNGPLDPARVIAASRAIKDWIDRQQRATLTPTPSVVKQSLTATQTGEKGESDA